MCMSPLVVGAISSCHLHETGERWVYVGSWISIDATCLIVTLFILLCMLCLQPSLQATHRFVTFHEKGRRHWELKVTWI